MSPNQQLEVMNQIDEPASYGIGIENISIYFRASSKEKNGTVDFFVKPIFWKNNLKKKKSEFSFPFPAGIDFFRQIELNLLLILSEQYSRGAAWWAIEGFVRLSMKNIRCDVIQYTLTNIGDIARGLTSVVQNYFDKGV